VTFMIKKYDILQMSGKSSIKDDQIYPLTPHDTYYNLGFRYYKYIEYAAGTWAVGKCINTLDTWKKNDCFLMGKEKTNGKGTGV
jgi:hypothetical protein